MGKFGLRLSEASGSTGWSDTTGIHHLVCGRSLVPKSGRACVAASGCSWIVTSKQVLCHGSGEPAFWIQSESYGA